MTYIHLDTDALDSLPPAEAYEAATQIHHQAKRLGAAYADRLAADLASTHGQQAAADMLHIHQSTLAKRVTRHKKVSIMSRIIDTHTVTQYVPAIETEISRTWEKSDAGVWSTDVDGTRWVLHYNGRASSWTGADRIDWEWGPAGSGQDTPVIKAATVEDALKEATWHIDIHPAVQERQRSDWYADASNPETAEIS